MAMTNRGSYRRNLSFFRGESTPTKFYVAYCTDGTPPTRATNTLGQLTQIATGNGYVNGGFELARSNVGWPTINEDDGDNVVELIMANQVLTADGGTIPSTGSPISYLVLTDDNETVANREVLAYWAYSGGTYQISDGATLTSTGITIESVQIADS